MASCARQSSAKLPRCGMMNATSGILGRQQLDDRNLAHQIVKDGQRNGARDLADLAADPRVVAMHLDADEAEIARPSSRTISNTRPRSRAAWTKAKP